MESDAPLEKTAEFTAPPVKEGGDEKPLRLSEEIDRLLRRFPDHEVSVAEMVEVLRGRAFLMLLLLFSLPFCTPVPLPGLSTPFGLIICVIGLRLALRRAPWLPKRLLHMPLPQKLFPRVLRVVRDVVSGIEKLSRPRLEFLVELPLLQHVSGLIIFLSGALLMLPLPVPFSNLFPAATVALFALANIGRDGVFALAAYGVFALCVAFFGALLLGGAAVAEWIASHFRGWFEPGEEHLP